MIEIKNKEEFQKEISDKKVLVDFYATWCGPCKMMKPIIEDIDSIEVLSVDVDLNHALAKEYKVLSIPSFKIIDHGKVIKEKQGFMSRQEMETFLNTEKGE